MSMNFSNNNDLNYDGKTDFDKIYNEMRSFNCQIQINLKEWKISENTIKSCLFTFKQYRTKSVRAELHDSLRNQQ